jgi:hypothetical protein
MLSVEVKIHLTINLGFIDPWSHAPRIARAACINCRRTAQPLTGGTHHDRSGQAHACARSLRHGNRRAAASHHIRPPTSPMLTVKIRQPSHEFTFGVGISFIPYPLVLTPVV